MGISATLVGALLAILERPSTWTLALVGFLVRGGWLVVLAPIVVLPSAVGVANVIAPVLEDVAFGRRTGEVLRTGAVGLAVTILWLVGGGLLAAATEVETVRRTVTDGSGSSVASPRPTATAWRVLAVRLVTLLPLIAAVGWAAVRFAAVGYRELTNPSDVGIPLPWRIAVGAPDAAIALVAAWLFAEIVGAIAARRVALIGDGVRGSLRGGLEHLRGHSVRSITLAASSAAVLLAVLAVTGLASATGWTALRAALVEGDALVATTVLLVLFVGLFAGGLILIGLTAAWRSAIWTVEVATHGDPRTDGTFGGGTGTRSGD